MASGLYDDLVPTKPQTAEYNPNETRFLDMLSSAEGADYNTIVGGSTFDDYSKHPDVVGLTTSEGPSTAAGRYQITGTTYRDLAPKLGITDFSPGSQDKIAIALIKRKGALQDVQSGNFQAAVDKLGSVWASLPSSPYSQPKKSKEWIASQIKSKTPAKETSSGLYDDLLPTKASSGGLYDDLIPKKSKGLYDDITPQSDISSVGAFGKSALGSALTAVAAAPAMALGSEMGGTLGIPLGPAGVIGGSIVGGIAGFVGGQKLVDATFDTLPEVFKQTIGYDKATRESERQAHPDASFYGDLAGNLALFRPGSLKDITLKSGKTITPTMQRAGMATFGAGMEAANQGLGDQPMDLAHIAEAGAFAGVAAKPTKYMDKLGGLWRSRNPVRDPGSEEWTYTGDWVPPETTADGIPIKEGPTGLTRKDGSPIYARNVRNQDGSSNHIMIDVEGIKSQFDEKPWTNPKVEGVRPLASTAFKTPEEWAQFVLRHEEEHNTSPRNIQETQAEYENRINSLALDAIRKNPYFNLADARVPPVPKTYEDLMDGTYTLDKSLEADKSISAKRMEAAMVHDNLDVQTMNKIKRSLEGDKSIKLLPHEIELRDKYMSSELKELTNKTNYLVQEGVLEPFNKIEGTWFPRATIGPEMSRWEKFKSGIAGGKFGGMDQALTNKPGAAIERSLFVGEQPNGRRVVLQEQTLPDGGKKVVKWVDKKPTDFAFLPTGTNLKPGMKFGKTEVVEAREHELEAHSPYKYEKNSLGVLYQRLSEINQLVRTHEYMKNLVKSEFFKDNSIKVGTNVEVPKGWKVPKYTDKMPELAGYAFEPRLAEAIEDIAKTWSPNALTTISGMLIKNMMLNPLPHMINEAWHLYNARGLTGWVTPAGIYRFGKTGMPALRDVMQQTPFFRELLNNGASLLSADVRNSAFADSMFAKANKEFVASPEGIKLAKDNGLSPLKLYDALSKKSNIAMWTVRDMMYVQQIKEQMEFNHLDVKAAIKEVERHMPSYRIPTHVGEGVLGADLSRRLSEVLQNPNMTVFSRYHYGMMKSLVETAKDISAIKKGKEGLHEFKSGVDTAAAIAVAIAFLYPLQDMIAQALTGNEDAKQRRAGPYHIFHAIDGIIKGEKDPMAALSSVLTFNPALLSGAQLIFDRQLYNGQPIYHPEDDPEKIAYDVGKYVATQMPQVSQAVKANKYEDEGWAEMLARQADIENPPGEVVTNREKLQNKTIKAGERRSAKWWMED